MELLLMLLVFLTTVTLVIILGGVWFSGRQQVKGRLQEIRNMGGDVQQEEVMLLPFGERVIKPWLNNTGIALGNLTPGEIRSRVEKQIAYSGNPWKVNFNGLLAMQLMAGVAVFLFSTALLALLQVEGGGRILFLAILLGAMGFSLPLVILNSKAEARKKEIQKNLPDMMDLLLVSVEAGLSFDMSLKKVADKMPGALSLELSRALDEMRMGSTREEALRGIIKRTGVADLSSFISAIIQAEQLGSNIANTLRVQAATIRQKRRQRIEESAMKAPIKMLFPLLIFVFPALFVVILGPAAIRIFQMFQEMM